MNIESNTLTDELLQRFLDGELEGESYIEIQDIIDSDDEVRSRFNKLKQINDLVAGYNRSVLSEPVPAALIPKRANSLYFSAQRLAAGLALICLGVLIGWVVRSYGPDVEARMLVDRAAAAHAVYTQEVLHAVEVSGDKKVHLGKWLSKRLGAELKIPDLEQFDYRLLGGRLLPGDEISPHALLMYEGMGGSRISVYVMRSRRDDHTNTMFAEKEKLKVFYWKDTVLSCAVVADAKSTLSVNELRRLSDSVYEQVEL